ncbi:hypothetical protein ACRALDRAFT_205092 [Sodiomyces alcalophilus JCM 7366]|uniref:uncharacterized protein n=1 Tax=Sodiomyces alcalophilus JCM 7366 TaxID=591952 RepID=UPI0039B5D02F
MAAEKRNEFLEIDDSEDEHSQGYDSEADEIQKGGRSSKRRKVLDRDDDDDDDEVDLSEEEEEEKKQKEADASDRKDVDAQDPDSTTSASQSREKSPSSSKKKTKGISQKQLLATEKALRKSGVIYLSRIPPYMKPQKLRSLLTPFGELNRIFLAPEDPASRTRRIKAGGNKKRLFTEGWVEFVSKKDAKRTCELLNARPIGGKKGSYYCDDVWNMVYLKGFKWRHLTEQIAAEDAERASRMRAEISRDTRENREFVRNVERAKFLDGVRATREAKKRKRSESAGEGGEDVGDDVAEREDGETKERKKDDGDDGGEKTWKAKRSMTFKQVPLAEKSDKVEQPEYVTRVLSKIF